MSAAGPLLADEATQTLQITRAPVSSHSVVPDRYCLRVSAGRDLLQYLTLRPGVKARIGRDEKCDMTLTDAQVSRHHAELELKGDGVVTVTDLGSTNGTAIDTVPITVGSLRVGELLEIGGVPMRLELLTEEQIAHLKSVVDRVRGADRDPLTGLYNRIWLSSVLPAAMRRAASEKRPLVCIFSDIDHFKQVNDRFGHAVGDEVLASCARLIRVQIRDSDACVRYGGEELVTFLRDSDQADAMGVAERVRSSVANHEWSRTAAGLEVTLSSGVAVWRPGEDATEWLGRADVALYRAKREGRNRVCAAE